MPKIVLVANTEEESTSALFDNIDFWCPGPQIYELKDLLYYITKSFNDKKFYKIERDNFIKNELKI